MINNKSKTVVNFAVGTREYYQGMKEISTTLVIFYFLSCMVHISEIVHTMLSKINQHERPCKMQSARHQFRLGRLRKALRYLHLTSTPGNFLYKCFMDHSEKHCDRISWASLVAQWLRICLPMQGTRVRALVWEDPTCRGATGPVSHNY